jgi:excisionase family DNA binding protein
LRQLPEALDSRSYQQTGTLGEQPTQREVVPIDTEISTQQAADLLNVSRPYVITLLKRGDIPFRKDGSRRLIRLADLLAYRAAQEGRSKAALAELAAQAQDLGLGY